MPIPIREPVPLVRRAERAWFAPTSCIGHKATFRRMAAREPPRATNAGGPAARDECVGHERERGRSARPLAIASSAASDCRGGRSIGTPCRPCCWSHGRGARRRGAAGWCARWSSARLALARTRRWAAAAQIMPLSIAVRAAPCCLHARARGAALWLPRRRFTGCPRPPPYPPPPPRSAPRPRLSVSPVSPCAMPLARIPRPLHPRQQQPHNPPLFGRLCRCAASREESTLVRAASMAVRHSAAPRGLVQAHARSRV